MPRFKSEVVRRERIRLYKEMALWCFKHGNKKQLEFFVFPNPVDTADARLSALCSLLVTLVILALNILVEAFGFNIEHHHVVSIALLALLFYGYIARAVCGPRLDPEAFFIIFILKPLLVDYLKIMKPGEWAPSLPRRFTMIVGYVCALCIQFLGSYCVVFTRWYLPCRVGVTGASLVFYLFNLVWVTIGSKYLAASFWIQR